MKKYTKLIVAIAAFVILIVGAKYLYDGLSKEYGVGQNLVVNQGANREDSKADGVQESSQVVDETADVASDENKDSEITSVDEETADDATGETSTEEVDNMAIDFTVLNADGEEVNLYSLIGKPIVINFWASWCGPCKMELPDFQSAYEAYDGEVEFMMVNLTDGAQETVESASQFWTEQGYTMPIYFDTTQEAAYIYGIYSIPTSLFLDAEGNVIAGAQGMIDAETLERGISMIY